MDDIKKAGRQQKMDHMWKQLMELVDLDEPTPFLDHACFGMYSTGTQTEREIVLDENVKMFHLAQLKMPGWEKLHAKTVTWDYDMETHTKKCVERYRELAHKKNRAAVPFLDDCHFRKEELDTFGELSEVCFQTVSKNFVARIGGPDNRWDVNKLARAITKWTRA